MRYVLFYLSPRSTMATPDSVRRSVAWACDKLRIPRAAVLIGEIGEGRYVPVYARDTRPIAGTRGPVEAYYATWSQPLPQIPPVVRGNKPPKPWTFKKTFQLAKRRGWPLTPIYENELPDPTAAPDPVEIIP